MEENLPLLRDIHLPPPESVFPLGYGWFLLMAVIVVLFLLYWIGRRMYLRGRKAFALGLIERYTDNSMCCAGKISEVLRRVCLYKYKEASSLYGTKWISFLNDHTHQPISGKPSELLVYAPYMPDNEQFTSEDYENLRRFAIKWIGENL